jgi:hypothetical protein
MGALQKHLSPDRLILKLLEIKAETGRESEREALQEAIEYIREQEDRIKLRKGDSDELI